jgi:hypothetical protein
MPKASRAPNGVWTPTLGRKKEYDTIRERIAKTSNPVKRLMDISLGELVREGYTDPSGTYFERKVRPTLAQQLQAQKILINKILPDLKALDVTTTSDVAVYHHLSLSDEQLKAIAYGGLEDIPQAKVIRPTANTIPSARRLRPSKADVDLTQEEAEEVLRKVNGAKTITKQIKDAASQGRKDAS